MLYVIVFSECLLILFNTFFYCKLLSDRLTRAIFGCRPIILPRSKFTVIPWPAGDASRCKFVDP